jgi:transposase InsO family protein
LALERGCWLFSVARSALDYQAVRPAQDAALLDWMLRLADKYPDWGYRLAHGYARNCGFPVNRKRFHRLWKQAKLQQPLRPPRRKIVTGERLKPEALIRNHVWCYDFIHDRDAADRMIRCLTLKDEATAYALAIEPGYRFSAQDVRTVLEKAFREYGVPAYIRSDQGGEFIANELRAWLTGLGVQLVYSDPGKPWHNASSESFNGTFRKGCLNRYEFGTLDEAKVIIERWRKIYNEIRPHSRLGYKPPASAYYLERRKAA